MLYLLGNYAMQTTAKPAAVTTGTNIKTLLQVKPLVPVRVKEWGISFDGSAAATPGSVELIETDVAATVTAHAEADITKVDGLALSLGNVSAILFTLSTTGCGYTASGEGTITAVRNLDGPQQIAPTTQFIKQFPLGEEPIIQAGKFGRVRVHFPTAVNCLAYLKLEA